MNKALDEVRAGESRRMASEGRTPLLKKSRWLPLKREENLKEEQRFRLRDLLRYNLKTGGDDDVAADSMGEGIVPGVTPCSRAMDLHTEWGSG
jgi:transposase